MADDPRYKPCPDCGQPKRQYVACEHCGYSFIAAEARKPKPASPSVGGASRAHPPQQEQRPRASAKVVVKSKKRRVRGDGPTPLASQQYGGKVVVYDKGREVNEEKPCTSCERLVSPIWQFIESDRGMVYLCRTCKDEALQSQA